MKEYTHFIVYYALKCAYLFAVTLRFLILRNKSVFLSVFVYEVMPPFPACPDSMGGTTMINRRNCRKRRDLSYLVSYGAKCRKVSLKEVLR